MSIWLGIALFGGGFALGLLALAIYGVIQIAKGYRG